MTNHSRDFGFKVSFDDHRRFQSDRQFRYKLMDESAWGEPEGRNPSTWTVRLSGPPPLTGANPGVYEVQLRGKCGTLSTPFSDWSAIGRGNASEPPRFVTRRDNDPLPDRAKFCRFDEGKVASGSKGSGCRILGYDPDTDVTPVVLTLGGTDGALFHVADGPEFDEIRVETGEDDSGSTWYVRENQDHGAAELIQVVRFNAPPDFEADSHPDGIYRITLTLTDEYRQTTTSDWTIEVLNLDEPEAWTLTPAAPQVGKSMAATVTGGDHLAELDFLWESSTDATTPRQWQRIPDSEQSTYTPGRGVAGQFLRVIVRYTDVGGAKEEVIEAATAVAGNQVPSFDASHGTRTFPENPLPGTPVGDPIVAMDTTGDILEYSLSGTDHQLFAIDSATGQLRTVAGIEYDFEATPTKTSFSVTVIATDSAGAAGTVAVSITLTDVDEDGTISGLATPQVGQELTPTLTDGSGTPTNQRWQWQSSSNNGTTWTDLPHGQYRNYVPRVAQRGHLLRVRVTYDSPEDSMVRELAEWPATPTTVAAAATSGVTITAPEHLEFTFDEHRQGNSTTPTVVGALTITASSGTVTLDIEAPATSKFTVANGNLNYVGGEEDYETLSSPEYPLRIKATAGAAVAYTAVTVTIENVEELGEVVIDAPDMPRPGQPLVATLTDDDGPEDVQWQWQERADGDAGWRSIAGATYPNFVPRRLQALLTNNRLRATVSYLDGQSGEDRRTVASAETGALQAATENALRVNQPYLRVRLPERVAAYASARERTLLHNFLPLGEDGRPAVPRAPIFIDFEDETDDYDCNEIERCWVNENYMLRAESEYTYSIIDGNAANRFEIESTGNLYYVGYGEDYEALTAVPPQYRLRVEVARGEERFHSVVLVTVTNEDDPGTMTITPASPTVGATLTAAVTDPDAGNGNELQNLEWSWGYVATTPSGGETLHTFDGATSRHYVPTASDLNRQLVAIVTYHDSPAAAQRRVEKRMANPVAAATQTNQPPAFPAPTTAIPGPDPEPTLVHYTATALDENASGVGTPIQLVRVAAMDPDDDTVTYSLPADTPTGFHIDSGSGQLTYRGSGVDYEHRSFYLLTVIASDFHGNANSSGFASVYVPVVNENEDEQVVLVTVDLDGQPLQSPETGTPIVARLQGGDRVLTADDTLLTSATLPMEPGKPEERGTQVFTYEDTRVTWQWQRSAVGAPSGWEDIMGATDPTYTPTVEEDANRYLRATASYYDVPNLDGVRQTASAATTAAVYPSIPLVVTQLTASADPFYRNAFVESNEIRVTVHFSQPVAFTGELSLTLAFDGGVTRTATLTGDGTGPDRRSLELTYTVALGDAAASGFEVQANSLALSSDGSLLDAREQTANLDHPALTIPHSVRTLVAGFPDINRDSHVNDTDGLIMYYEAKFSTELGDGTVGGPLGTATMRATLLGPLLAASVTDTEAGTLQLLRSAKLLRAHEGSSALDLNGSGTVDEFDALTIYYVLRFPELVGDGSLARQGFDKFRLRLLGPGLASGVERNQSNLRNLIATVQSLTQP